MPQQSRGGHKKCESALHVGLYLAKPESELGMCMMQACLHRAHVTMERDQTSKRIVHIIKSYSTSNIIARAHLHVQASFLLGEVLQQHPRMGTVVVGEVQRFVFRPGLAPRARYTAIIFLNQLQLSHSPAFGGFLCSGWARRH